MTPVRTRRGLLSTRPGRTAAAALTLVAGATLAGCQLASPLTTDLDYEPADGVSVYVGDVVVRDLVVVSESAGSQGRVTGLVVNQGSEPASVSVHLEDQTVLTPQLEIAPGDAVRLDGTPIGTGEAGQAMTVAEVPSAPGSYLTLLVEVGGATAESASVPILSPEAQYSQEGTDQAEATDG